MLKNQILIVCALLTLVLACSKKDSPGTPPVNATLKAVQDYLSQTDNLKTFAGAFQATTIAEGDLSNGITVFAPANSAITSYDPNARVEAGTLTADEVKDHVIRGVIKRSDLTNGKKLLALSGKELVVVTDGDKIYVNGALILDSKEASSDVVFTIDNVLCKKGGSVEITVYDATQRSTTDTLGKVVANADVALYYSRKDFINGGQPAFSGKTAASGKILFGGLAPGTYYLVTKKDDKFNYIEPVTINGELFAYKPLGIFQNQNQLNTLPKLSGEVVGDFTFLDADQDGLVNTNDKTRVPFDVVIASNKTVKVNSLIGYLKNQLGAPFSSKAEAQQYLDNVYSGIGNWQQLQTVMDGILSDDADCSSLPNFCGLDNFSITATNTYTTSLWQNGYNYISMLNRLITNVPGLNLSSAEANDLTGQAKGLRGYIYFELATYYGGLPLQTGATDNGLSRSTLGATYNFIKGDLTAAVALLPALYTGTDHNRIGGNACRLLLARIALAQNDYYAAQQYSDNLIQSMVYSLQSAGSIFTNDANPEIVWNILPGIASAYTSFFNDGKSKAFTPVGRFAEVLLINEEARVAMNDLNAANLNLLLGRSGQQTVNFTDQVQAMGAVQAVWKSELSREGQRFAKLVKWNKASDVLGASGYKYNNALLPIPLSVLQGNPNLNQNVGY